jgi:hypothetical protein
VLWQVGVCRTKVGFRIEVFRDSQYYSQCYNVVTLFVSTDNFCSIVNVVIEEAIFYFELFTISEK